MPNSTTKTSPAGIYVPGGAGAPAASGEQDMLHHYVEQAMEGIEDYARREPWSFAAWVFGVGFVLGWKHKIW